jgi:hypothetical protein
MHSDQFNSLSILPQSTVPTQKTRKSGINLIPIGMAEFDHKSGKIPPKAEGLACMGFGQ